MGCEGTRHFGHTDVSVQLCTMGHCHVYVVKLLGLIPVSHSIVSVCFTHWVDCVCSFFWLHPSTPDPLSSVLCKVRLNAHKRLHDLGTLYQLHAEDEREVKQLMVAQDDALPEAGSESRLTSEASGANKPASVSYQTQSGRATNRLMLKK